jgi:formylmethanofuran dehydrogenase subunit C
MKTTTLRVKHAPGFRLDASPLLPATLCTLTVDDIAHTVLHGGNESCATGELFEITQRASETAALIVEGDVMWLDRVGSLLAEGEIRIEGAAGDYAGFRMTGGRLEMTGNAGHHTACEMRGGRLTVEGSSGDFAAGALPGDMEGMTGGTLTIMGHAGARLGDRMRRGLVLVGGDAGDYAGSRMVAGTIGIAGQVGAHCGYGMRRGTLLLAEQPRALPPTFAEGGRGFDVFWTLLVRSLAGELPSFAALDPNVLPRRLAGDLAVDGRGELLIVGERDWPHDVTKALQPETRHAP